MVKKKKKRKKEKEKEIRLNVLMNLDEKISILNLTVQKKKKRRPILWLSKSENLLIYYTLLAV